jgi:uncharacterized protein
MIHPDTELKWINPQVGHGVVATRFIPRGTLLWTQCAFDIVLDATRLAALSQPMRDIATVYGYVDHVGDTILCWDLGRFVNHACLPAMLSLGPHLEVCVRDLQPGDELTCDYGTLNYSHMLTCQCGHPACRGQIRAEDALAFGSQWQQQLEDAVQAAKGVAQPLLPYVRAPQAWHAYLSRQLDLPTPDSYYLDRAAVAT